MSLGVVDPQMNKFERVSSDHHQMLHAGQGVPYHVTYPMMHLRHMDRQNLIFLDEKIILIKHLMLIGGSYRLTLVVAFAPKFW